MRLETYARQRASCLALLLAALVAAAGTVSAQNPPGLQVADIYQLKSVGEAELSPDGRRVAYTVVNYEKPGRPYAQVWVLDVSSGRTTRVGTEEESGSGPRWSPDGTRLAYFGRATDGSGILITAFDGSKPTFIGPVYGTNHPLPSSGERLTWSPDGRSIAFVSSTPGPEPADADPLVITRYLYKPTAGEGTTRLNDNRRTHVFVADLTSKAARQLTTGHFYEHSIDWSPKGDEILFVSNRSVDPDRVFNYDIFAVNVGSGAVRRLTDTKSAEYYPAWSPDGEWIAFTGTTRPLTSSETTMEDTHVWVMKADGSGRLEIGKAIDNRQGPPAWGADAQHVFVSVQDRGSVKLLQLPRAGGSAAVVAGDRGSVGSWSVADGTVAYAFTSPGAPSELYVRQKGVSRQLTSLNTALLARRAVAPVEAFTFNGPGGVEIEAFLTRPAAITGKHPLIVMIHGGPHGQQGPAFSQKAQIYAARGWATLMVNYRGSTGYGQRLADAIFRDQNGDEARDVLAGVDAALARHAWIDPERLGIEGGSYGGQLTNWIVTQTPRFKAAIPFAGIANLVSFNYMAYYHDYLAVEYGSYPHEQGVMDLLWDRSPIRFVHKVRTPTLFLHGENDNDVPIAEAEQLFIALMDVGVDTQMVRYPREGHGLRETQHVADSIERSMRWYERYFTAASRSATQER